MKTKVNEDLISILKKNNIMAIDCYYDNYARLISRIYCYNKGVLITNSKPSSIINILCEMYNYDSYTECVKKTKKFIMSDKKVPIFLNDKFQSIWLPLSSTTNDTHLSCWINMAFISINKYSVIKSQNSLIFIFEDGQKLEYKIKYKNFMLKWGEGAALNYELEKVKRRILRECYEKEKNDLYKEIIY